MKSLLIFVGFVCLNIVGVFCSSGWTRLDKPDNSEVIEFSFFLKDDEYLISQLDSLLWSISDPKSGDQYRNFMTKDQISSFLEPQKESLDVFNKWMADHPQFDENTCFRSSPDSFRCSLPVELIEESFHCSLWKYSQISWGSRDNFIIRADPAIPASLPLELVDHVSFIFGLNEFFVGGGGNFREKRNEKVQVPSVSWDFPMDVPVFPDFLRERYGFVGNSEKNKSVGIIAFNDQFSLGNLRAFEMIAGEKYGSTQVTQKGELQYPMSGFESDLDVQYSSAMMNTGGSSGLVEFVVMQQGEWILDWASQLFSEMDSSPRSVSLSYGWPESFTCGLLTPESNCTDPSKDAVYIGKCNNYLKAFAVNGISVFVSSGDRGAPSFSGYCPVDAEYQPGGWCPLFPQKCKCSSVVMELEGVGQVMIPNVAFDPKAMILAFDLFAGTQGSCINSASQCSSCLSDPGCLISQLPVLFPDTDCGKAWSQFSEYFGSQSQNCAGTLDSLSGWFVTNCTCDAIPPFSSGKCSIKGYSVNATDPKYPVFLTSFPGDSPYVTSVGATQITSLTKPYDVSNLEETVASIKSGAAITSGGGFSWLNDIPSYQKNAVNKYLQTYPEKLPPKQYFDSSKRAYPDISLLGHNYLVVSGSWGPLVAGQPAAVDGTSCSSPTLAGMISTINAELSASGEPPLGFLNPLLYQMASDCPECFVDIKEGDIDCAESYCCLYGYEAAPGWDAASGLGVPYFPRILEYIRSHVNISTTVETSATHTSKTSATHTSKTSATHTSKTSTHETKTTSTKTSSSSSTQTANITTTTTTVGPSTTQESPSKVFGVESIQIPAWIVAVGSIVGLFAL